MTTTLPRRIATALSVLALAFTATPSSAGGDLLVAPLRVVLDGARGTEVILKNLGTDTTTYRISLELRRMTTDGDLVEVTAPTPQEAEALSIIAYAPRRVTLLPNQPQAIRIGVRAPQGLPDGEYRAHMLFRAIPESRPVTAGAAPVRGISVALTPIYGVTIPIIVRRGQLEATAGIANARLATMNGRPAVALDLERAGGRSVYGEVRVLKPGNAKPVALVSGVAVYKEVGRRALLVPVAPEVTASLAGPATIQYIEIGADGGQRLLAEARVVLR